MDSGANECQRTNDRCPPIITPMPDLVLEVADVRKRYGATVALDGVSLAVEAGEVFGLLGPNGGPGRPPCSPSRPDWPGSTAAA